MDILWDTNILVHQIRGSSAFEKWNKEFGFFKAGNRNFISIVSVGEILALSLKRNWGKQKVDKLHSCLDNLSPLPIAKRNIIDSYSKIDAYSQGKYKEIPSPEGSSSKNMGKNDIWIAATAHAINATLITTDQDFSHLDPIFITIELVNSLPPKLPDEQAV